MKRSYILIIVGIIVLIGIESYFLLASKPAKPEDPLKALWAGNYTTEKNQWRKDIEKRGTETAYAAFKQEVEGKPFGIQHTMAHIFGELIYEKEGITGIQYCDATFAYGCYHSFSGKAIIEHGLNAVKSLDEVCMAQKDASPLGCLHGIGHGILGYVGYGRLSDALDACSLTSWQGPLGGCTGGVFMEYNFHTMESIEGQKTRKPVDDNVFAPCDSVNAKYKQECFYNQAQWWVDLYSKDFPKVGALCEKVNMVSEREACLRGLGDSISSRTGRNPEAAVRACKSLVNPRSELLCREGAWRVTFADVKTRADAPRICAGLSGQSLILCSTEFNLK